MATSNEPASTQLRIRLHASNLPWQGRFLKIQPDTYAVVTSISSGIRRHHPTTSLPNALSLSPTSSTTSSPPAPPKQHPQGVIWGRTETVYKCSNPQWTDCIAIDDYMPGDELFFYVHIFRHDDHQHDNDEEEATDFTKSIGSALFEASNVLATCHQTRVKRLRNGGCIFCRLEQYEPSRRLELMRRMVWQFAASELLLPGQRSSQRLLVKKQQNSILRRQRRRQVPLVMELAKRPAGKQAMMWVVIHRSSVVLSTPVDGNDGSLTVVWDEESLDLGTLCNGDLSQPILITIKCMSSRREQSNMKVVGMTETSLQHLLRLGELALQQTPKDESQFLASTKSAIGRREQLSAAVTGKADESYASEQGVSESYAEYSSSEEDDYDDEQTGNAGQASAQEEPLGTNELFLQRSQVKIKRVGRLQVLKAELVSIPLQDCLNSPSHGEEVDAANMARLQPTIGIRSRPDASKFQHYLDQCLKLEFCVAIDFTSSNGDPRKECTNHYQDPGGALNDYEETILALGKAIEAYSDGKKYQVLGFGAKFAGVVRHLFQLGPSPTVEGVDGVLTAYRSVFASDLIMSGPTILTEVMQKAAIQAKDIQTNESPTNVRYNVLLIITDGLADSFEETQRKIAVYSQVPLSIVIVGVGRSSGFDKMYQLATATQGCRRTVSFVEFRKHQDRSEALAAAALQDLPAQVCEYMAMRGL